MQERSKIYWVARNRSRPSRTKGAAALVTQLAQELGKDHEEAAAVAEAISPIVNDEFRRCCRVEAVSPSTVTIGVSEAALVSAFRIQWSAALLGALRGYRQFSRIQQVLFRYGHDGAGLNQEQN